MTLLTIAGVWLLVSAGFAWGWSRCMRSLAEGDAAGPKVVRDDDFAVIKAGLRHRSVA